MKKRCLALALVLALAAAPVRAEGAAQTVMTSDVSLPSLEETPVIDVTVPQTGRIVINPYGLPTEIGGGVSTEQIASETMTIFNASAVPVIVSAGAAGHISESSGMTFAFAPPAADTEEKEIFLYAEFQREDGLWSGSFLDGENQILIFEGASAAKEVLTLGAGPSTGVFRMFGATSVSPADPWGTEDQLSVTFTFTFSPVDESTLDQASGDERAELPEDPALGEDEPFETGEIPMPEETEAPAVEETPAPEETPAAEVTPVPEETPAAEATPTPDVTPMPEETGPLTPEETHIPEETDVLISESDTKDGGET